MVGAVAAMVRASALHVLAGLRRGEVVMVVVEFVMVIVELVGVIVIVIVIVIVSVVVVGMMGCILISLSSPCFRPVGSSVSLLRRRAVMVAAAVVMSAAVAVVLPFSVYLVRGFGLGLRRRRKSHLPGVFADG